MDERTIIIADRDAHYRSQLADLFRKAGYRVESADSVPRLVCSVLGSRTSVLLLGSDFDDKVSPPDLIHLLKRCNRLLQVIMVSDQLTLAQARKVRQEGIFYHALKPATTCDSQELGMAVESAFRKILFAGHFQSAPTCLAQSAHWDEVAKDAAHVKHPLTAWQWTVVPIALICSIGYLAAEKISKENFISIGLFLCFCALIIATQLLPIFRIKLPASRRSKHPAKQERASWSGK